MSDPIARLNAALDGRYRIVRELGEGGMATVYLAHDVRHHRDIAIKVMKPELAEAVGAERFLGEIEVTANLQHPHILALFDSGEADGFLFFVMPYIEGETLRDRLRRENQLPVDEAVGIARKIAGALAVAHEQGVIHRDIKPANILLSRGEPVVADFGISLAMAAEGQRLTQTGITVGTPYYMSPEQATGDQSVDSPTDVYSLACVLYEMLVGEPPYVGNTAQAVLGKILQGRVISATAIRKSIPANVDAAIRKALERLPADRFTSAQDFARALADPSFRHGTGSAFAASAGPWRRLSIGLAALAVMTTTFAVLAVTRPDAPTPVIRYLLTFEGEAAGGSAGGFGTSVALSEDGSNLVYVGDSGEADFQLFLRRRDGLEATAIPGTQGGYQPFFSPDGRQVGFIEQATRELKVVSLGGEPPVTLADFGIYRLGASWGRDGYVYFSQMPEGGIARIPATGGEVEPISTPEASQGSFIRHSWPDVLPNGRGVLVTIQRAVNALGQDDDVAVVDVETGEVKVLFRGILGRYATTGHLVFVTHEGGLVAAPFDQDLLEVTGPSVPIHSGVPVIRGPDVAMSRSGRLVYSTVGTTMVQEIVWVDRSGGTTPFEPGWTLDPERESGPSLSPDGRSIAVAVRTSVGEPEVWVKQLGGPLFRLAYRGGASRPRWSLDGRSIIYVTNVGGAPDLFTRRADGSGGAELVLDLEAPVYDGVWSRDGEWLVIRTGPAPTSPTNDILGVRPSSDGAPIPLVTTDFQETSPALSPDGRFLAYVSNESGRTEVYVRPFPNVNDARFPMSTDGGREPLWAHNGRELFYKNASRELVAVTLTNGPALEVVGRTTLFQLPPGASYYNARANYDISSDDQRFLMFRSAGEEARTRSDYIVVENFYEELKARVPN